MDDKKTLQDIKNTLKTFCEARDWDQFHGAKELAIGISTEAAELLAHFRFKSDKEIETMFQNAKKKEEISDEMADVLWFLVRLSQKYNIDLTEAFEKKVEINNKRYPVEKFKSSNKKYNEL